ncbi:MAG: PD40 domain-containing protein [Planctomycetes bacterium]|nr:PD40 domain-containing protein [Planctomycetota bacterium]
MLLLLVSLGVLSRTTSAAQICSTEWISTPGGGQWALGDSTLSSLSSDGRYVSFHSGASNLVTGDNNGKPDVFVVDRWTHTIERVSVGTGGIQGNGSSGFPDISGDGRFVVFLSASTNLDPGDTHPAWDVYRHDRQTHTTLLVSKHLAPPTKPNGGASEPNVTPDGRFAVFNYGEDIVAPGDTNGQLDVFLTDMLTGVTELISLSSDQVQGNRQSGNGAVSADGRYVAFVSWASNWYPGCQAWESFAYVRDRSTGTLLPVNLTQEGVLDPTGYVAESIDLSEDGRYLVYKRLWYGSEDVAPMWLGGLLVRDLVAGTVEPIAYSVFGNNTSLPWTQFGGSENPAISADGRFIAFQSYFQELVLHSGNIGPNIFVHDRLTGLTQPASLGPNGQWPSIPGQTYAEALYPAISADGSTVSFTCEAPSFGSGNAWYNIYVRSCDWSAPQIYCEPQRNSFGCKSAIEFSGAPSATAGEGFTVRARRLVSSSRGFLFYGTGYPCLMPFQGGYLCMDPPIVHVRMESTGGSASPDCTGSLSVDFNAWIASGADPRLVAGENVALQAWSRDPGSPFGTNLTDAVTFVIAP